MQQVIRQLRDIPLPLTCSVDNLSVNLKSLNNFSVGNRTVLMFLDKCNDHICAHEHARQAFHGARRSTGSSLPAWRSWARATGGASPGTTSRRGPRRRSPAMPRSSSSGRAAWGRRSAGPAYLTWLAHLHFIQCRCRSPAMQEQRFAMT